MGGAAATLAQQGWQLWQGGRPADAIPKFELAVKLDPKNSADWNGLVDAFVGRGWQVGNGLRFTRATLGWRR